MPIKTFSFPGESHGRRKATAFKPKKSVALSGTVAGNTAVCTVGRTGNDLHYRGYDILDFAEQAEFEEIAHLLIHGTLPNAAQLQGLQGQAEIAARPAATRQAGAGSDPRQRTPDGCDAHRMFDARHRVNRNRKTHSEAAAHDMLDRLLACFGSMLLYWYHFSTSGQRIDVETDDDSVGGHFLHLLHGTPPKHPGCAPCTPR